jgi:ADP-L-glycero-D-manno-heptose 6-epimerase
MRIAVTGGMGFIGHEVVSKMVQEGHEVVVVDFWKELVRNYEKARLPIMQEIYRDLPLCHSVVEPWDFIQDFDSYGPHIVVHAGAIVNTKDLGSDDLFDRNVTYTQDLTKACSDTGAHIIFFSSAAVYGTDGTPNNPYGLTKAIGEKIVRRAKTRTAALRLFNVFGRNEHHKGEMASVPFKFARAARSGGTFNMHSLTSKRDFVPVETVVDSVVKLADVMQGPKDAFDSGKNWHKEFDVGTGLATSFLDMARMVCEAQGRSLDDHLRPSDMPAELIGRYQHNTCAGKVGIENLGGNMGTEQGIRRAYGVDK